MKPMKRRRSRMIDRPMIAYDLETTPITAGETPTPLYLSLCDGERTWGIAVDGLPALASAVRDQMLVPERVGCRYVAYNANRFDAYLVARAMATDPAYHVEPWLAKNHAFRGMMIREVANPKHKWYFSDPMAMYGYEGSLASFIEVYAPEYAKLSIDVCNFTVDNQEHVEYALNDAEALYHATIAAAGYLHQVTGQPVQNTIGKSAVRYFESQMPEGVLVWRAPASAERAIKLSIRGGFVHCPGVYEGVVWKYDINQAYAGAMRHPLPSGRCIWTRTIQPGLLGIYRCLISRPLPSPVPFVIRDLDGRPHYTAGDPVEGWITTPELDYLYRHGWSVTPYEGWFWTDSFTMSEMVDRLERARRTCPGGPSGPLGKMYKAVGNNAYGKTLEQHDGIRLVFASERPDGYKPYMEEDSAYDGIWFRIDEVKHETYHRPQLGAFITSYVRVQIMDAAMGMSDQYVYADTDCVVFRRPASHLDIHPTRYGAYKQEVAGEEYLFITKKVYCSTESAEPSVRHAKGLHARWLTLSDFRLWARGTPPDQQQTQRANILAVLAGQAMFRALRRQGSFVPIRLE